MPVPTMTGRLKAPVNPMTGLAEPAMVSGGGLAGATRTVWGHAAVVGRLNIASALDFAIQTILGALKAASRSGAEGMLETVTRMAANAVMQTFETELRRARVEAFERGVEVGRSEAYARLKAEQAAAGEAVTIFPRARHYLRKQDQATGMELAQSLTRYSGGKIAEMEEVEDVDPRPVTSISGWVQAAGLVKGQLAIQFKGSSKTGPVVCIYPEGGSRGALESILNASSAGKWVHAHVYAAKYELGSFR